VIRAALVLLAGCNSIFGLDETRLPPPLDAPPDAPGCSGGTFTNPVTLSTFANNNIDEDEPQLRHDLLELWFHVTGATDHLYRATRASVNDAFGVGQPPPFAVSAVDESDATITGDGLRVLFLSKRGGVQEAWEAVRPTLDGAFETPHLVGVGGGGYINTIDVSFDGLRLYMQLATYGILVAERPSLTAPFGTPQQIHPTAGYATISPDERELYFNLESAQTDLYRVVRATAADPWPQTAELVFTGGEDPDIAADGRTLAVMRGPSIVLFTRDCP
jgi:hypothetical protein